ncbi:PAS domain S-box protein [Rhodocyclus tenuis]|uniref:histidine kinase n=2 Tax=Rhodocyclus gracilis TaxID=2929842 RepID=A0ABX0WI17_9RHOO|nr:PAS domain S-box protein [Rhodocyclus gracilis]
MPTTQSGNRTSERINASTTTRCVFQPAGGRMSLRRFLIRLIWLCILPLLALSAYLVVDSVRSAREQNAQQANDVARNFATALDLGLKARIGALNLLAVSPLANDPALRHALYEEALGFRQSFGGHVALADPQLHLLFNTRQPFGSELPPMPRPAGRAAVPLALASGEPAVGDSFIGPVAKEPLIAVAVPGLRGGRVAFLVIAIVELAQFQQLLDQVALPSGWAISLRDGAGVVLARRAPAGFDSARDVDAEGRFVVASKVAPWTVTLEIPRELYRTPMLVAGLSLVAALLLATVTGVFGALSGSRRLGEDLRALTEPTTAALPLSEITEVAAVRHVLDVTAESRRVAEFALRASEQRFRATFEQAAVGLALVDPEGRWLRVNHKLCDIVGYTHEELLALDFQAITYPDDLDSDLLFVRRILAGELSTYSMEKRYVRKDGELVWINLTVALVRREDAQPDYFISVVEDIQRRKQAELALKAREATLSEAQRLTGIGNWSWDLRRDVHSWSEEIYRIYGRDPALPPAGVPEVQAYFTPASWAEMRAIIEAAMREGIPYAVDAEVVRPDGTHRWITARGEATRDASGDIVELHGTVQDITERKEAADALHELNASLEQRVEQRTADLIATNQELDTFAYAVSHDLRAPLRAMNGFSKALLEDYGERLDGEARLYLDQIIIASRKMGDLIDGILALSRSMRGELHRDVVNISEMSRRLLADLILADPARVVEIEIEPGLRVHGDARLVEAVMLNLLGNAWKYTARTAAARICVRAGEVASMPGICVVDNGAGFDMAHAEQLFQPFRRLHRQDEFPGIGIGLATVQRIVRRHGGDICAHATPGQGASFCFALPAVLAEEGAVAGPLAASSAPHGDTLPINPAESVGKDGEAS